MNPWVSHDLGLSTKEWSRFEKSDMETSLTNLEICIALIIAINVAVLALRLCVSLYKA